ncbi:GIY-YIG nuclease family protein [Clostridium perfringens]|uniref:GIY-YIG nuclease family protein n=1 Tax=Clostridium perfringens TaxID=1502 RepID=UPI0013E299CD|nr:GIY-YIG nuclease family protein [Clostridium perfringens]MBI6055117.1 GIY-YIG nuclease family protein [Clostridium perfringens]MBO3324949.1 GIY-YIG nuclease family protein [Clostridium perfringens]MDT7916927.1 GIY-YIG nuclease family protein [Clostridium perfringens]MDT7936141.1 GIY-YIG nuclease family protein [Clostridium perfringens]MDT7939287.1 GIY-YIG nuclease family protein [Clostridium perfringens]
MRREESWRNQEMKIGIGGVIYSNILEDYQDGKIKTGKKLTLNDFMSRHGYFTSRSWTICHKCKNLVTANLKNKKYCASCAYEEKREQNRIWIKKHKEEQNKYHRIYQRQYQLAFPEKVKEWDKNSLKEKYKGLYIYYLLDNEDNIKYIGQTTNMYTRAKSHLSGNDSTTKEFVESKDFKHIVFKRLDELLKTEDELKKLESYLLNNTDDKLLNKSRESKTYASVTEAQKDLFEMLNLDIESMKEWV